MELSRIQTWELCFTLKVLLTGPFKSEIKCRIYYAKIQCNRYSMQFVIIFQGGFLNLDFKNSLFVCVKKCNLMKQIQQYKKVYISKININLKLKICTKTYDF